MRSLYCKMKVWQESFVDKMKDETGAGVVEVAVIVVILIGLAMLFRDRINVVLNGLFDSMEADLETL